VGKNTKPGIKELIRQLSREEAIVTEILKGTGLITD
jgi:hypothetical protein